MGYFPIHIRELRPSRRARGLFLPAARIPISEMSLTLRQLSDLIGAGLSVVSALGMVSDQSGHPVLKGVLHRLSARVREGQSLSQAMHAYPDHFPVFYTQLIFAGETGGTLGLILERLADHAEKQEEIRAQVRAALAYPLFIVFVGAATVLFLMAVVVPRLAVMFSEFQQDLPAPTQVLLGTSRFLRGQGWLAVPAAAILYFLSIQEKNRKKIGETMGGCLLRLPVLRAWILKKETGSYLRTLGALLKNGVPILAALNVSAGAVQNASFRKLISPLEKNVGEGMALSAAFRKIPVFPAYVCNMAAVGEEGGRLADSLDKTAAAFERDSQRELKVAVSLLEPLLILAVGSVLGLIVLSILLPIFEMNALIH